MAEDAKKLVLHCDKCQKFSPVPRAPPSELIPMGATWPFHKWGIDIQGPYPMGPGGLKFIVVAIDYNTKWVEAEPLATITGQKVWNFFWKFIICRFGIPHTIVTDNGKQFAKGIFKDNCEELKIVQKFASVANPQANGQVEVTNRTILQGIKKKISDLKGAWPEKLQMVLWSNRTTPRESTGQTPFKLVYGSEAMIPVEVGQQTWRRSAFVESSNEEEREADLCILEEQRELARMRLLNQKEIVARCYNKKVRERRFQVGDLVVRKLEASRVEIPGKLSPNWEGPYTVKEAHPSNSYTLENMQGRTLENTWNAKNLKKFYV